MKGGVVCAIIASPEKVANATTKLVIRWLVFVARIIAFSVSVLILSCVAYLGFYSTSGKLNAIRYNGLLKVGMSQLEETTAENQTHAALIGTLPPSAAPLYEKKGIKLIWFTSWAIPCMDGGPIFALQFDNSNRLRSWYEDQWVEGC